MKTIEVKYGNYNYYIIFIDEIKNSKFYYMFFLISFKKDKSYNNIKRIYDFIDFLNRDIDKYPYTSYFFQMIILDKKIYITFDFPFNFLILKLGTKCRLGIKYELFNRKPDYSFINITFYLNSEVKNILIKHWNNCQVLFVCYSPNIENDIGLYIEDIYKIGKIEKNRVYIKLLKGKDKEKKINNFIKDFKKYKFKK